MLFWVKIKKDVLIFIYEQHPVIAVEITDVDARGTESDQKAQCTLTHSVAVMTFT